MRLVNFDVTGKTLFYVKRDFVYRETFFDIVFYISNKRRKRVQKKY